MAKTKKALTPTESMEAALKRKLAGETLTPSEKKLLRENTVAEVVYKIDHAYLKSIEKELDRKLSNEQRAKIDRASRMFRAFREYLPKTAKGRPLLLSCEHLREDQQVKIDALKGQIDSLIKALDENGHLLCDPSLDRTMDALHLSLRYAEKAQKGHGKPTGKAFRNPRRRPPEIYRHDFIRTLAGIYKEITGKAVTHVNKSCGIYGGPFFRFVAVCIKPVETLSNSAIGTSINSSLR